MIINKLQCIAFEMRYASLNSFCFLIMKKILITSLCFAGMAAADWTVYGPTGLRGETLASGADICSWNVEDATSFTWQNADAFSIALTLDVKSLDVTKEYTLLSIKSVGYKENDVDIFNGLANISLSGGNINLVLYSDTALQSSVALAGLGAESSLTLVLSKTTGTRNVGNLLTLDAYVDNDFDHGTRIRSKSGWSFSTETFELLNFGGSTADYYGSGANVMPPNADAAEFILTGAAYMTGGVATADDLKNYSSLVPEPTTATLSLLALAGLAARRRRK